MKFSEIDSNTLNELLYYDKDTGELFWKQRDISWFSDQKLWSKDQCCRRWNTSFSGKPALSYRNKKLGYFMGNILGCVSYQHRAIWHLVTGELPLHIDHINGNGFDNRWINLRSVPQKENLKNRQIPINNSSGVIGVAWMPKAGKWRAAIQIDYKSISLGHFDVFEDAVAARKAAEAKYGFHPNHGRSKPDA